MGLAKWARDSRDQIGTEQEVYAAWAIATYLHRKADRHVKIELFPGSQQVEVTVEPNPFGKISVGEETLRDAMEHAFTLFARGGMTDEPG